LKFIFLLVLVLASGCSKWVTAETADTPVQFDAAGSTVKVFRSRGSLQCAGGGIAPEVMRQELAGAGITVWSFSCGHDGLFRAAVCGSSDGNINIFQIPASKIGQARSLGFADLVSLPSAAATACPK